MRVVHREGYIHMKPVCVWCVGTTTKNKRSKRLFDKFSYFLILNHLCEYLIVSVKLAHISIIYIMLKLRAAGMVISRVYMECFVSMQGYYFLFSCMFFSVIEYCKLLVNFFSVPPKMGILTLQ